MRINAFFFACCSFFLKKVSPCMNCERPSSKPAQGEKPPFVQEPPPTSTSPFPRHESVPGFSAFPFRLPTTSKGWIVDPHFLFKAHCSCVFQPQPFISVSSHFPSALPLGIQPRKAALSFLPVLFFHSLVPRGVFPSLHLELFCGLFPFLTSSRLPALVCFFRSRELAQASQREP